MLRSKAANAAQQNYKRCAAKLQTLRNARSPERRGVSATLKPSHAHHETETRALLPGFAELFDTDDGYPFRSRNAENHIPKRTSAFIY